MHGLERISMTDMAPEVLSVGISRKMHDAGTHAKPALIRAITASGGYVRCNQTQKAVPCKGVTRHVQFSSMVEHCVLHL